MQKLLQRGSKMEGLMTRGSDFICCKNSAAFSKTPHFFSFILLKIKHYCEHNRGGDNERY